jgi:hypothetical protein
MTTILNIPTHLSARNHIEQLVRRSACGNGTIPDILTTDNTIKAFSLQPQRRFEYNLPDRYVKMDLCTLWTQYKKKYDMGISLKFL